MQRFILVLSFCILSTRCQYNPYVHPPVPGLPQNTDPTTLQPTTKTIASSPTSTGPQLLDNYIPPVMQALAYYIELLQYEPTQTTTLEPPFHGIEAEGGTTYTPPKTTPTILTSTTTTTPKPWWQQSTSTTKWTTTTKKPFTPPSIPALPTSTVWWKPPTTQTPYVTTPKPSTIWWQPPSSRKPSTTSRPSTIWWQPTSTRKPSITSKPSTIWWQPTSKPSTIWWQPTSTRKPTTPTRKPTTATPWWQTTTTRKPYSSTLASWIATTTKRSDNVKPTPYHRPGVFAPMPEYFSKPLSLQNSIQSNSFQSTTTTRKSQEETSTFSSLMTDKNFFDWLFQPKAVKIEPKFEYNLQLLDPLPAALLHDITYERYEQPALLDNDNVNEFLRVYDDSFGRYRPITGKKRIPPTKPYVDFLMLYDLLKRDAKAMNFSKYEGYTPQMLRDLEELSHRSAERQLHTLLTRLLLRNEIGRNDVLVRVKSIIKDLENPNTVTSMSMRFFPPLQFVP